MSEQNLEGDVQPKVDAGTPISYLCLDFSTPLPTPHLGAASGGSLPPRPGLNGYGDPIEWPTTRKYVICHLLCIATMLTTYAAGAYSPPVDLMAAEYGVSRVAVLTGTTTFCIGFALAPMVLAPFSELSGRYPVFVAAGVLFVFSQVLCGLVLNLAGMLVARFLSGVGCSVFSTMIGGVIADMWPKEERNTPMAIYSGAVLIGTGLGPFAASLMVYRWADNSVTTGLTASWRWVFWHQAILDGACVLAIVLFLHESRGSVLLGRKARALNTWHEALEKHGVYGAWVQPGQPAAVQTIEGVGVGEEVAMQNRNGLELRRIRWLVENEEQRASIVTMIRVSVSRPFTLLFTEPVVLVFAFWASFSWAVLFLCFSAIPLVFKGLYGFNTAQVGYMFVSMMVGSIVGAAVGVCQESLLRHSRWKSSGLPDNPSSHDRFWSFMRHHFPVEAPESRLYLTCFTSVFLPLGLYLFKFAAQAHVHWIVPALGVGFSTFGVYTVYLATFNYLADSYRSYASSALAAQGFCRYALAGIFPLVYVILSITRRGRLLTPEYAVCSRYSPTWVKME